MVEITSLPDVELVRRVKESACSDSFSELSKRHGNLFYRICQNYIKTLMAVGYSANDIFAERECVIFDAITGFNPDKGVLFSTWLGNFTRYFCLNKINAGKKIPKLGDEEEAEAEGIFDNAAVEEFEGRRPEVDLNIVIEALTSVNDPRITNIFRLRYDTSRMKKRTWANIAQSLGLTVQTTMQLHKKGLKIVREQIMNNDLDIFADAVA